MIKKQRGGELFLGKEVISFDELKELAGEKYNIIIGSKDYFTEIRDDLNRAGFVDNVYSYYGVNISIALHSGSNFFSPENIKAYLATKENEMAHNFDDGKKGKNEYIIEHKPDILIYQSGKVGSSSVYKTLKNYGKNVLHLHTLMTLTDYRVKSAARTLREEIENLKIITMVREPLGKIISSIFQNLQYNILQRTEDKSIEDHCIDLINEKSLLLPFMNWFDNEIKQLTGIDVYECPFDKEKGYAIIEQGNVQILILQMEKLTQNQNVIGEFCGINNFQLTNENISSDKIYADVYKKVKQNLHISPEVLERLFNNKYVDHFYTEEDKNMFVQRYMA